MMLSNKNSDSTTLQSSLSIANRLVHSAGGIQTTGKICLRVGLPVADLANLAIE
jgi:hypothetical protein